MTESLLRAGELYITPVGGMEAPITRLCEQLKPRFEEGRYGLIIGDDTSGRLPTLAIRGFSRHISGETGQKNLPVIFLQASRKLATSVVEQQVNKRVMPYFKADANKSRALIITDFVLHGHTMRRLSELLSSRGIDFDVAVMTRAKTQEADALQADLPQGTGLFMGEEVPWNAPEVYNRPDLSGLRRASMAGGQIEVIRAGDEASQRFHPIVSSAREDIRLLIARLVLNLSS